jgi:hypothetical protein
MRCSPTFRLGNDFAGAGTAALEIETPREPARAHLRSVPRARQRSSTSPRRRRHFCARPGRGVPRDRGDANRRVRSHRARTGVVSIGSAERKSPAHEHFLQMERAGFEPAASDLQTRPIARRRMTRANRIGMTEPKSALLANLARHRWTTVRSHRARTAAAEVGNDPRHPSRAAALPP